MAAKKIRYELSISVTGSRQKIEEGMIDESTGKEVTREEFDNVRRVRKSEEKRNKKIHKLETVSLEQEGFNLEKNPALIDSTINIEEDYIRKEEYCELHEAIGKLLPSQIRLYKALYVHKMSKRAYAQEIGITHTAVVKQDKTMCKKLRVLLSQ